MSKVSIIVPLYNKAPYITKALESVKTQTVTDWECIIVNDGSTDNSVEIVERLMINDDRFRLINQKNAGVSAARNKGIAESKGEYVCFLDADDWWAPTFLEKMMRLVADYPEAGIYGCNYYYVYNGVENRVLNYFGAGYINYAKMYLDQKKMPLWTGAVLIPRMVLRNVGLFNEKYKLNEDFDLWVRIAAKYKVVLSGTPLAYYNQDVELAWRAIGKLYKPECQLAFDVSPLRQYMEDNEDIKHVVEMVQIVCLRQYYVSKEYHEAALQVLSGIDLTFYEKCDFAAYIWKPIWLTRFVMKLVHYKKKIFAR